MTVERPALRGVTAIDLPDVEEETDVHDTVDEDPTAEVPPELAIQVLALVCLVVATLALCVIAAGVWVR